MNKDSNYYKLYIYLFYLIITNENEFSGKIVNKNFFDLKISKKYHYFNNNLNR